MSYIASDIFSLSGTFEETHENKVEVTFWNAPEGNFVKCYFHNKQIAEMFTSKYRYQPEMAVITGK